MIDSKLASLNNWGIIDLSMDPATGEPRKIALVSPSRTYRLNQLDAEHKFNDLATARQWLAHVRSQGMTACLGFGLSRDDNILCVDIDLKGLPPAEISYIMAKIKAECATFWTVSQSGKGLHLYYTVTPDLVLNRKRAGHGLEVYMEKRYLAEPDGETGGVLSPLCSFGAAAVARANSRPATADAEDLPYTPVSAEQFGVILERANAYPYFQGFSDEVDYSAGDWATFKFLAKVTDYNPDVAAELFRQSGRYNQERVAKKNKGGRDYFEMSAVNACRSAWFERSQENAAISQVRLVLPPVQLAPPVRVGDSSPASVKKPEAPWKPTAPPAKVWPPTEQPAAVEAKPTVEEKPTEVNAIVDGVVLNLLPSPPKPKPKPQPPVSEVLATISAIKAPTPKGTPVPNKGEAEAWPPLKDGSPNPSGTCAGSLVEFIRYTEPHELDWLPVAVAKCLMRKMNFSSKRTCLLAAFTMLSSLVGRKAYYMRATGSRSFPALRLLNIGDTGTGKTALANAMSDILNTLPAIDRPEMIKALPVSSQGVYDSVQRAVANRKAVMWYLPEQGRLLAAEGDSNADPHAKNALNQLLSLYDASLGDGIMPGIASAAGMGGDKRPALSGTFVTLFGDTTKAVYNSIFGSGAESGSTNRLLINFMTTDVVGFEPRASGSNPMERRTANAAALSVNCMPPWLEERLKEVVEGSFVPGERATTEQPMEIELEGPLDDHTEFSAGAVMNELRSTKALHSVLARSHVHIASMLLTAAAVDPLYDKTGNYYCIPTSVVTYVRDVVEKAGEAVMKEGDLVTDEDGVSEMQNAIINNIIKVLSKPLPKAYAGSPSCSKIGEGIIPVSLITLNIMQNRAFTTIPVASRKRVVDDTINELSDARIYFSRLSVEEAILSGLPAPDKGKPPQLFRLNLEQDVFKSLLQEAS